VTFFRYAEAAEHAFFRSLGLSIQMEIDGDAVGWPRVQTDCRFIRPLRFEDEVRVHLLVREVGRASVSYHFVLYRLSGDGESEVARGNVVTACVKMLPEEGKFASIPVPENIRALLQPAPRELLDARDA
jgi:acyl-CoA thioesterase FadM